MSERASEASARARARETDRGDDNARDGVIATTNSQQPTTDSREIDGRESHRCFVGLVRPFVRSFARTHPRVDSGAINGAEREDAEERTRAGPPSLLHEQSHSGHYTRRRATSGVACFVFFFP